jgi:hypothetical protein
MQYTNLVQTHDSYIAICFTLRQGELDTTTVKCRI